MAGNLPGVTNLTGLNVGGGGNYPSGITLYACGGSIVTVVATTVTASTSVETTATISGLTVGDYVGINVLGSGLSQGVSSEARVSAANTVTIRYSNASTAAANQIATPIQILYFKIVP